MKTIEFLTYLTEHQIDGLFEAARALPADKLAWKPAPGARSALDQLQEVATAPAWFTDTHKKRKMEFDMEAFQKWREERSKITDIDELEKLCRANMRTYLDSIKDLDEAELGDKYEMPFPGEFKLADILTYHFWNISYHEGQINYIQTLYGDWSD